MRHTLLVLLLGACSSDVLEARRLPESIAPDAKATVDANNAFACDLYQQLRTNPSNVFTSPFSISVALSMLDLGAAGNTDAEFRAVLHQTLSPGDTAHAYHAILDSLDTGTTFDGYSLEIANRAFGQEGFPFLPSYLEATNDEYGAPLEPVDFATNPSAAINAVNDWVSRETDGEIPSLFEPDALDSSTRLVVANAIHFKGAWDIEFDSTSPGPFYRADGTTTTAPMMTKHYDRSISVAHTADVAIAKMPFRGKDMTMVVLLPTTSFSTFEDKLTPANLATWLAMPGYESGQGYDVTFPKFSIDNSFDLGAVLMSLGLIDAWTPAADFSGIDGARDLSLQRVQHQARISVDEHGATASAATGAGTHIKTGPPTFIANQPFVFLIHDEVTGAILFMGRLMDPTP